ncbi:MAG: peptide chain release factor N(5)-glutamine methyltransferase [Bacteroidales bacterium]|jgi:release factor glutamine methyltransferase|nr:peptide chain release factor N(5)-glutamine methyltransferase [Bacteroidales bacterium]
MSTESYTIADLKRSLLNDLQKIFHSGEAYSICRIILEHYGYPESSILKNPSALINYKFRTEIKKIVKELNTNRPIQYILGETFFYDLRFFVDENVLIPRPETEELVSNILLETKQHTPRILDIGCGSGCIAISLAHSITDCTVHAMDVDIKAIEVAKKNAAENNVQIEFIHNSLFDPHSILEKPFYDIIVSNPPYVTQDDRLLMSPNVTKYEPELALFVPEDDPLIFYREIVNFSKKRLKNEGVIWFEINEKYGEEVKALLVKSGYINVKLLKDIHGKNRFINARSNYV